MSSQSLSDKLPVDVKEKNNRRMTNVVMEFMNETMRDERNIKYYICAAI